MDEAESRKADHERDAFARFMPCLAGALEEIVGGLSPRREAEAQNEKRAEEDRRLLSRTDLPVM